MRFALRLLALWSVGGCGGPAETPPGMVRVPGGSVATGVQGESVTLEPFFLDRLPVTVEAYATASGAGGEAAGSGTSPVVALTHAEAEAWCAAKGARLPTEWEWALAATGGEGRTYPWGNAWDARAVSGEGIGPIPVGAHPRGAAASGAEDLVGNVFHWTASPYVPAPGEATPYEMRGPRHALRGACCPFIRSWSEGTHRVALPDAVRSHHVGFRCARPAGRTDPNPAAGSDVRGLPLDRSEVVRQLLAGLYGPGRLPTAPAVAEAIRTLPAGAVVADIGCGLGAISMDMARQVGEKGKVYAVDRDAGVLEFVGRAAAAEGLRNVVPVPSTATSTNLPDASCALLLAYKMIDAVNDTEMEGFLASCLRALAPGGRLVIYHDSPPARWMPVAERLGFEAEPGSGRPDPAFWSLRVRALPSP